MGLEPLEKHSSNLILDVGLAPLVDFSQNQTNLVGVRIRIPKLVYSGVDETNSHLIVKLINYFLKSILHMTFRAAL